MVVTADQDFAAEDVVLLNKIYVHLHRQELLVLDMDKTDQAGMEINDSIRESLNVERVRFFTTGDWRIGKWRKLQRQYISLWK